MPRKITTDIVVIGASGTRIFTMFQPAAGTYLSGEDLFIRSNPGVKRAVNEGTHTKCASTGVFRFPASSDNKVEGPWRLSIPPRFSLFADLPTVSFERSADLRLDNDLA